MQLCWRHTIKKLVPEKNLYQTDPHACKFLVPDDLHRFLVGLQVSCVCIAGITVASSTILQGMITTRTPSSSLRPTTTVKLSLRTTKAMHNNHDFYTSTINMQKWFPPQQWRQFLVSISLYLELIVRITYIYCKYYVTSHLIRLMEFIGHK